jgi:ubiquinone/menaquinone biosynthesis C-methylase UbiE
MHDPHHAFVANRYGPRAREYVSSAVHAAGEDLDRIEAAVRDHPTARVLDLGCGGGHVSYRTAPHVAEVVAVDLSEEMLEAVQRTAAERNLRNIELRQCAAESLPFPDASFDIVLSRFSAHHWSDFEGGMREARRVLAPQGRAMFVDSVSPGSPLLDTYLQALEVFRDATHVRNYSAAEWQLALVRAGFVVTATRTRRVPIEFSSWIARTRTTDLHAGAIRSLLDGAPEDVRRYFLVDTDGSFVLDTLMIEAE